MRFIDDEAYRRRILIQLNRGEGRHQLARVIFHGRRRGELRQRYRDGQEDQLRASPSGARGTRVEVWFQDEAPIGQKKTLTRVWGKTGSRPAAVKDLGFTSAYVFGAVCPGEGKAAAIIMPICNTIAMDHHLREISSQVGTAAHAVVVLDRAGWHQSQALAIPRETAGAVGNAKFGYGSVPPMSRRRTPSAVRAYPRR